MIRNAFMQRYHATLMNDLKYHIERYHAKEWF
jgi:hypothetical protein